MSAYLDEQKQHSVDIHFIPYGKAPSYQQDGLDSIDFGVIDKEFVLVCNLKERIHVGGTILYGEEHVDKYTKFFNKLFKKAVDYNNDRIILVNVGKETCDAISKWPHYRAPYEEMDYAINSLDEAWLPNFGWKPKRTLDGNQKVSHSRRLTTAISLDFRYSIWMKQAERSFMLRSIQTR